ncbi:uncharacterized protein LOC141633385 [Silene latifolia]|uniref:uncharacterized protein LOC141633385 n=1 Tax=Silene latifolia TaxID=37657 RepID=UPI003D7728F5
MAHSENVKTFAELAKHVEMEVERQKALSPSTPAVALAVQGTSKNNKGKKPKGRRPNQTPGPRGGVQKQHKAKGRKETNVARVKCYNCGKKGHFARDCTEPKKIREQAST